MGCAICEPRADFKFSTRAFTHVIQKIIRSRFKMTAINMSKSTGKSTRINGRFCRRGVSERVNMVNNKVPKAQTPQDITEPFSAGVGTRILHIGWVAAQLAQGCTDCKEILHLSNIHKEHRIGLASLLMITCKG